MRKLRVYLDTSIINFLFADDALESKTATTAFFEDYVGPGVYDVFISPVVVDEIVRTPDKARRNKLMGAIEDYALDVLEISDQTIEIQPLAQAYIDARIIPKRKLEDALHIAIATVNETDVFLSWNYRHLANVNKEMLVRAVNLQAGYTKPMRMTTPLEVMGEQD
jgi:predicted nucleic acid-binding protein